MVRGKPVAQVPVKTDPEPLILVNEQMKSMLGLTFPEEIMKKAQMVK